MKFGLTILAGIVFLASGASAQVTRINQHKDWDSFKENGLGEGYADCWIASDPRETVNTKGGEVVSVKRDDILLQVAFRKGSANAEIAFTGGYYYNDGATVAVVVDGKSFTFMTKNAPNANGQSIGWAWPRDPSDEAKIVAAMKRGAEAVVTGRSSRGTTTKDTFSLLGFTAALADAQRACAG